MFGFKSKRVKKLERENAMLDHELRELQREYEAMLYKTHFAEMMTKKVVPLRCSAEVDTYFGEEDAIRYAKREIVKGLADGISEYVTFSIRESGHTLSGKKLEVIGTIEVLNNSLVETRVNMTKKEG